MAIDVNLAKIHSKAGRKVNEDSFWNTYLECVKKTQTEYFNQRQKHDGWVNLRDKYRNELQGIVVSAHGTVCYEDFVVV